MTTELIEIYSPDDKDGISRVAEILKNGGIVAIPTETVYGLAADATNENAVKKIFRAKGRPQDNPLIVHISSLEMAQPLIKAMPEKGKKLADAYWPGPLTMIFERTEKIPASVSAGLSTVAIRFPKDPIAKAIISGSGLPLAAPSANISGKPSPTTAKHCIDDLMGKVDAIVISHDCEVGVESTVISMLGDTPALLRPGAVTKDDIINVIGEISVDRAVLSEPEKGKPVASPGMKYKHYSPKAEVFLVDSDEKGFIDFVNRRTNAYAVCTESQAKYIKIPTVIAGDDNSYTSYAHGLFSALRELDRLCAQKAYAILPPKDGIGLAVYNRLIRAAAFRIIKPDNKE